LLPDRSIGDCVIKNVQTRLLSSGYHGYLVGVKMPERDKPSFMDRVKTRFRSLLKIFWVVTRRNFLVYDQRFGITCLSHLQGLRKKKKDFKRILSSITTTAEAYNFKIQVCRHVTLFFVG
jgi:sorbitol-specific phosphotransferase system component IIC